MTNFIECFRYIKVYDINLFPLIQTANNLIQSLN